MISSPEYLYSEKPAIELLQKLGYTYYSADINDEREDITTIVLEKRLRAAIKRINPWINENNLQKAFDKINQLNGSSLMEINQQAWDFLKGATHCEKQLINGKEEFIPVSFIDYENILNNDFLIVSQTKVHGKARHSIPDILVYLNGLPVGIIECKSPHATGAWDHAFNDLKFYQENSEKLFYYNQVCAGTWKVGARYGAISSPQAFYSVFKSNDNSDLKTLLGPEPSEQDTLIYNLFKKENLLDIIRHFVIFELEEGRVIKKLPRYQQIRATNNTVEKLQQGEGGVVWHTQGSGKSITMAYVTRKLQAKEFGFNNPTVLIMTDRKDLDRQITDTFRNTGFKNVHQASSVEHLDKLLRNDYGGIITTTLQKFQEREKNETNTQDQTELDEIDAAASLEEETEDITRTRVDKQINGKVLTKITSTLQNGKWVETSREEVVLDELSTKENLFVLVDEAHRSQYGFLASFMRTVLPHAKFIAFTGTPISKEDKSTLGEFYGGDYIDVYTIKESVADGATVELLYDNGIAKLDVKKQELDKTFEETFGNQSEEKKDKLKEAALRKYALSSERINAIALHMIDHYRYKIFPDGHKAMVVCDGRYAAIRYKQAFEELKEKGYHNFDSQVVVTLGSPKADPIAKEYYETLDWNKKNPGKERPVWVTDPEAIKTASEDYKLPFGNESEREKSGKKKFDNTALLIVSDMLLTGYDAPIASCLYLDKPLKEHNLLQAIARVNRSGKGKNAGHIVDYYGITDYLIQALEIYSGDLRREDILKNINEEFPKLELNHNKLVEFFKSLRIDRAYEREKFLDAALRFIEPLDVRDEFKELLKQFNKSINIVLPNTGAMRYQADFKLFNELKLRARNAYPDDDELKISSEESKMLQQMIDEHLKSTGVQSLLAEPISIIDKDKFKEEIMNASPATKELKMRNNLKYVIKVGLDKSPDFFKPLAQRLEELLKEREEERITQAQLLLELGAIQDIIINQHKEGLDHGFATERQRAVYDSMKPIFDVTSADATRTVFDLIKGELDIVGWEEKGQVRKEIENKLTRFLTSKLEREVAKAKAKDLVEVLKKNKDA
jgi:type I restriction enzyme R subunit